MTPLEIAVILTIIVAMLTGAFWLGWDVSVRRFNSRRRREQAYLAKLDDDVDHLTHRMDSDEVRAGIDTGKEYVVFRVQGVLDEIQDERR